MPSDMTRVPTGNESLSNVDGGYDKVDDPVGSPDDYNSFLMVTSGSTGWARFYFSGLNVPSGSTINYIQITCRAMSSPAHYPSIKVNGNYYNGNAYPTSPGTWNTASQQFVTNPATGLAWTVADINGTGSNPLQAFGFYAPSAQVAFVTQVYLTVNYSAGAYCAMGPSGGIFSAPAIAAVVG
jgi:hypothetical protein